jgi:hypothetical protein
MGLRVFGVAVALAGGCWTATAHAGQYVEVWNPPEAQHAPKHAKVTPVGKRDVKAVSHSKGNKTQTLAGRKTHGVAVARNKTNPSSKVAQKSAGGTAVKSAGRAAAGSSAHLKTAAKTGGNGKITTAQAKSAHTLTASRSKPQKLATRPAPAQSTLTMDKLVSRASSGSTRSTAPQTAPVMTSAANSPGGGGGNLPPILH